MPAPAVPEIDRCFNKYIHQRVFSAGACVASVGPGIFHRGVYGTPTFPPPARKIEFDAVFDLASLTKPLGTALGALLLAGANRLDLSVPLSRTIPEFADSRFDGITLDMLLDHTAGFPASVPFWESLHGPGGPGSRVAGTELAPPLLKEQVAGLPVEAPPGSRVLYSDVGFLILGWILEEVTGKPLDVFLKREILDPLGLSNDLFFVRLDDPKGRAALRGRSFVATEECPLRGKVLVGEVHDPTAWAAGGVCGHAGLFGTVDGVWKLMRALWECYDGGVGVFHSGTVRRFFTRSNRPRSTTRTLGWDTPSAQGSTAGKRFSRVSVGHLGFTGTSVWMDLRSGVIGVVLANSVHPTVEGKAEQMKVFRPRIYELIAKTGELVGPGGGEVPSGGGEGHTGANAFGK